MSLLALCREWIGLDGGLRLTAFIVWAWDLVKCFEMCAIPCQNECWRDCKKCRKEVGSEVHDDEALDRSV